MGADLTGGIAFYTESHRLDTFLHHAFGSTLSPLQQIFKFYSRLKTLLLALNLQDWKLRGLFRGPSGGLDQGSTDLIPNQPIGIGGKAAAFVRGRRLA